MTTATKKATTHVCGHGNGGHQDEQAPVICGPCGTPKTVLLHRHRTCPLTGGPAIKLICPNRHKRTERQYLRRKGWVTEEEYSTANEENETHCPNGRAAGKNGTQQRNEPSCTSQCRQGRREYFIPSAATNDKQGKTIGRITCGEQDCAEGRKTRAKLRSAGMIPVTRDTYIQVSELLKARNGQDPRKQHAAYRDIIAADPIWKTPDQNGSKEPQQSRNRHSPKGPEAKFVHCYNDTGKHAPRTPACAPHASPHAPDHKPLKFVKYSDNAEEEARRTHGLPLCPKCRKTCSLRKELIASILR